MPCRDCGSPNESSRVVAVTTFLPWSYYRHSVKLLKSVRRFLSRKLAMVAKHNRIKNSVFTFDREPWVLCRTACLGNEVRNLAFPGSPFLNFQKGRVDKLENLIFGGDRRERPVPLISRLALVRKDVWDLLVELNQVLSLASSRPPRAILIDSYSDLTDQLFQTRFKDKWFLANYADMAKHTPGIRRLGLLPLDNHGESWRKMLNLLTRKWGEVPIFLLTYPTVFETRGKFLERGKKISMSWEELAVEFHNVHLIQVPPQATMKLFEDDRSRDEKFPYHYGPRVSRSLARTISDKMKGLEQVGSRSHFAN